MLTVIPVEVVLKVLSFIPLRQLQRLKRVSRGWEVFFAENKSFIYHAAAILHGFVPADSSLIHSKVVHVAWLADVHTWEDLCKEYYAMESRWEANGRARYTPVIATGEIVHRFTIDTEQRTVITTHFDGGLCVFGIDEDEILWSLSRVSVDPWAFCEYDKGFLVFNRNRNGHAMEVWRRKRDSLTDPQPPALHDPDLLQRNAHQSSFQSPTSVSQGDRGAFIPWALILPPGTVGPWRLVFPTLLIASSSAQEVYFYDVVTGRLTQTISLGNRDAPVAVNCVELGARHIFVCTEKDVLILPRDVADSQAVLNFPSQAEDFDALYAENTFTLNLPGDYSTAEVLPTFEECPLTLNASRFLVIQSRIRSFTAVRVSPCGSHFVATDKKGYLYLVRNFEQAILGIVPLSQCVTILDLLSPIMSLALFEDKRACIHVQERGIFVVPTLFGYTTPVNTLDMRPRRVYPRLLFANLVGISDGSPCIQLTRTELWIKKETHTVWGRGTNRLHYLDFTKPQ